METMTSQIRFKNNAEKTRIYTEYAVGATLVNFHTQKTITVVSAQFSKPYKRNPRYAIDSIDVAWTAE